LTGVGIFAELASGGGSRQFEQVVGRADHLPLDFDLGEASQQKLPGNRSAGSRQVRRRACPDLAPYVDSVKGRSSPTESPSECWSREPLDSGLERPGEPVEEVDAAFAGGAGHRQHAFHESASFFAVRAERHLPPPPWACPLSRVACLNTSILMCSASFWIFDWMYYSKHAN